MTKIIKCKITPELIKKGKKKFCGYCPAALAIRHAFTDSLLNLTKVEVNGTDIDLEFTKPSFSSDLDEGFEITVPLSKQLKKFINDFDASKKVMPMNFVLKVDLNG